MSTALRRCDDYLDAVAALACDAVDVGALRAFVSRAPWPYYVRPRPGADLSDPGSITAEEVRSAAEVLSVAGQAVSFEWVEALAPTLEGLLRGLGYTALRHPLLVRELGPGDATTSSASTVARLLDADSPDLAVALVVQQIGFDTAGTAPGPTGPVERDARAIEESLVEHVRSRIGEGSSVVAVVEHGTDGIIACGWHQPLGDVTEIVGVATLPSHRRRGAAGALLDALVADAVTRGVTLAILSAGDEDVARIYEGSGFTRVGTVGVAEPAAEAPA